MRLERFQVDDLLLITPRPPTRYPGFLAAMKAENGMGLTLWNGNSAVGAAGITRWPQAHEGWIYLSPWFDRKPLVFHRLVKQFLPMFARYMKTKVVVARIEPGLGSYAKWPIAIGMTFAGRDEDGFLHFRREF